MRNIENKEKVFYLPGGRPAESGLLSFPDWSPEGGLVKSLRFGPDPGLLTGDGVLRACGWG